MPGRLIFFCGCFVESPSWNPPEFLQKIASPSKKIPDCRAILPFFEQFLKTYSSQGGFLP